MERSVGRMQRGSFSHPATPRGPFSFGRAKPPKVRWDSAPSAVKVSGAALGAGLGGRGKVRSGNCVRDLFPLLVRGTEGLSDPSHTGAFSLSIRDWDQKREDHVKHYKIRKLDMGGYYITTRAQFETVQDLVRHYMGELLTVTVRCHDGETAA